MPKNYRMGCIHSFWNQANVLRKKISKSKKSILTESIDYSIVDTESYRQLYMFYFHYAPQKLTNPYFIYLLLHTYHFQLFTLWDQLEDKYGPRSLSQQYFKEYRSHMYERIHDLYVAHNPQKLNNPNFISSLLQQYDGHEHELLGKITTMYSTHETFRRHVIPPQPSTPRPIVPSRPIEVVVQNPVNNVTESINIAVQVSRDAAVAAEDFAIEALLAQEIFDQRSSEGEYSDESNTSSIYSSVSNIQMKREFKSAYDSDQISSLEKGMLSPLSNSSKSSFGWDYVSEPEELHTDSAEIFEKNKID